MRQKGRPQLRKISDREQMLHQITNRIRCSLELSEILMVAAQEIRAFLNVDRAKIYRFDADGSGEVIAESIDQERLPSLLNLRFPAEDIPHHAREMFIRARQRVVVDVFAQRKTSQRLDHPETGENLLETDIRYAPVDPCHAQYLSTMGVMASLVVPILHQRKLWGLLAVHHAEPHQFSERELQIVQLLVDQVSIAIAQSNLLTQAKKQAEHEATINQISHLLHCPLKQAEIRQRVLEAAVEAFQGSGGRLYISAEPTGEPAQLYMVGEQASADLEETELWRKLLGWQQSMIDDFPMNEMLQDWQQYEKSLLKSAIPDLNSTGIPHIYTLADLENHPELYPIAAAFKHTSVRSIAIVPLQFHQQFVGCLTIFRNGYDTKILWAGHHHPDDRNKMPRASFETWCEIKTNQVRAWTADEIKLAQSIGLHLYMAVTQKRVESMIRYQASHDSLTKLPNRLLFNQQLSLAIIHAQQQDEMVGVAFLDLDRFKTINDTLGHALGDQLLQQVADRLQNCLRHCDAIARWGGDEFTLLLPHLNSAEEITRISQRILDQLRVPFMLEEQELYVTASLGIALAPYDGEDAEMLLKNADAAMYQAKQQGKNTYQLYFEEMGMKVRQQLTLEGDLRRALMRGELMLYYQPQIDIRTGRIFGLEALIRWNHPDLGFISPAQFIPLAEETGLICAVGDWVLQTACSQHQIWKAAGLPPIQIAINLSAQQFQQVDLVNSIIDTLKATQVDPRYLEVEITESAAMKNVDFTILTLQHLEEIGVQIAMDDFGTGYSSLNALKHFPLHTLKIDRSFVRDAVHDVSDAAIAKAIVALGKGLGLKVLAEGVETQAQLEWLRAIECDSAQGYLFSKPVPPEAIVQMLAAQAVG
ncbi:MAG TPA: EAL domain-containing protein [Trichocoleus sp.]|jgi:diguanylate cyclase (GGDEF)-like protein